MLTHTAPTHSARLVLGESVVSIDQLRLLAEISRKEAAAKKAADIALGIRRQKEKSAQRERATRGSTKAGRGEGKGAGKSDGNGTGDREKSGPAKRILPSESSDSA